MPAPRSRTWLLSLLKTAAAACLLVIPAPATQAAEPAWWNDSAAQTKIWATTPQNTENWAPINVGQLKHVAVRAQAYLHERLQPMGGAGTAINTLCSTFTSAGVLPENDAPANVGQLKYVAKLFYDRLYAVGLNWQTGEYGAASQKYPWTPWQDSIHPENGSPANVGQLKNLFAFTISDNFKSTLADSNSDGIPDYWMRHYGEGMITAMGGIEDSSGHIVFDANALFAASEDGMIRSSSFGPFIVGYNSGTGFTRFLPSQHTGKLGFFPPGYRAGEADADGVPNAGTDDTFPLLSGYVQDPATSLACALINRDNTITAQGQPFPRTIVFESASIAPYQIMLHPAASTQAMLRFMAPVTGSYQFAAAFSRLAANGVVAVTVRSTSGAVKFTQNLDSGASTAVWTPPPLTLNAWEGYDFIVDGGTSPAGDSTGLVLSVKILKSAILTPPLPQPQNIPGIHALYDTDGDGLSNLEEYRAGTSPVTRDTDGDGISDQLEVLAGLDPRNSADTDSDTDSDGISNGVEAILRRDAPGLLPPASQAWLIPQLFRLDPVTGRDEDGDGVPDDYETVFGLPSSIPTAVYDANEAFQFSESGTAAGSAAFGPFVAGYYGAGNTTFTASTAGEHTPTASGFLHPDIQGFQRGGGTTPVYPIVAVNRFNTPLTNLAAGQLPLMAPGQIFLHPDNAGRRAVLRFVAPAAGDYSFAATFQALSNYNAGDGVDVAVLRGNGATVLYSQRLTWLLTRSVTWGGTCTMAAGETLDFTAARNGNYNGDSTGLTLTCLQRPASVLPAADMVHNANQAFAATESAPTINPSTKQTRSFGPFRAGYFSQNGISFTDFRRDEHIGAGGFYNSEVQGFQRNEAAMPYPVVAVNRSGGTQTPSAGLVDPMESKLIYLQPDNTGRQAALRFTAPVPGNYVFSATFRQISYYSARNGTEVSVIRAGTNPPVFKQTIGIPGGTNPQSAAWTATLALAAGETFDFAVASRGDYNGDSTGLTLEVRRLADGPATDTDEDGLPDRAEALAGTWAATPAAWRFQGPAPAVPAFYAVTDENQDGVPDVLEPRLGLAAIDGFITGAAYRPLPRDTDNDGVWDGQEALSGSDPRNPGDARFPSQGMVGTGTPPPPSGGAVNPALVTAGYSAAGQDAFHPGSLQQGGQELAFSAPAGSGGSAPSSQDVDPYTLEIPKWYYSELVSNEPNDIWSEWIPMMGASFGQSVVNYKHIYPNVWKPVLAPTSTEQTLIRGKYVPIKISVDEHRHTQLWRPLPVLGADLPVRKINKTWYERRNVRNHGIAPVDYMEPAGPTSELNYLKKPNIDWYYEDEFGAEAVVQSKGEFYFGSADERWQYMAQKNGVRMRPKEPNNPSNGGGVIELAVPSGLFDEFSFDFPPLGLEVKSANGSVLKSGISYTESELGGSYITASTTDNSTNGSGIFIISVSGKRSGSAEMSATYYNNIFHPKSWALTDHAISCRIPGPSLKLIHRPKEPKGNAYSLNLAEDGGSRFRKISLEGLPLADGKPQTGAESDSRADDTYVDALNHTLSHHTSDVHVPLAASDLAISADRALRQEAWLPKDGQRPPSATGTGADQDEDGYVGRPFGSCWTSNLTPHVVLDVDFAAAATTPPMATVVDETGSTLRFAYVRSTAGGTATHGFLPLPSPSDQTSLLNRLDFSLPDTVGAKPLFTRLDLKKRFGTTVHYQLAAYSNKAPGTRFRFYFRILSDSTTNPPGIEDRFGNKLYYSYSSNTGSLTIAAQPPSIAALLIPSSIADRRVVVSSGSNTVSKRRLVITPATTNDLGAGFLLPNRFISKVAFVEENGTATPTLLQETKYLYQTPTLDEIQEDWIQSLPYSSGNRLVLLHEVSRKATATVSLSQFFDYSSALDQSRNGTNFHLWLSKMTDGAGRYHRFETVFDRTRTFYYADSQNTLSDWPEQGLDRAVSAVYFGAGDGTELLLSEFQLQRGPGGQQPGFKVDNSFALGQSAEPSGPPPVTGNRINTVVDADRRVRYYKFTEPTVRDTKVLENYFFPNQPGAGRRRHVLISWTRMEIDHTGGARETYTFNPQAMMALTSSEMVLPGSEGQPTRTDWEYRSEFKAANLCPFLVGKTYTVSGVVNPKLEDHPFFAKYYPDPTSEVRTLSVSGLPSSLSVPEPGAQIVKTFKYWADENKITVDGILQPDNSKPWSRTMVESVTGYRDSASTSPPDLATRTRAKTTLDAVTGLPVREEVYGPGTEDTAAPDKKTEMTYKAGTSFLTETKVIDGVGLAGSGQNLVTTYSPDQYLQVLRTVTGFGTDTERTCGYTQRNALGQIVAQLDGKVGNENLADPASTTLDLTGNTKATRHIYRLDGRLSTVTYPAVGSDSSFPSTETGSHVKTFKYDDGTGQNGTGRKLWELEPDGTRTVYNYDARGRVLRTFRSLNPSSTSMVPVPADGDQATTSTYSAAGLLLTQTSPSGLLTINSYDWLRRLTGQQTVDTANPGQPVTTAVTFEYTGYCGDSLFSSSGFKPTLTRGPALLPGGNTPAVTLTLYDSLFRKVQESREYAPGAFAVSSWGYDCLGRVIATEDAEKLRTLTSYDKRGNVEEVVNVHADSTGTVRLKTRNVSTSAGLILESRVTVPAVGAQPYQERLTTTAYDAAGRVREVRLPSNPGTAWTASTDYNQQFDYDTAGRRTVTRTRQSAGEVLTSTTVYDARGREISVTGGQTVDDYGAGTATPAQNAPKTEYKYDRMNRRTWTKASRGAAPLPSGTTNAQNPEAALTLYDTAGRVARTISPVIPVSGSGGGISWVRTASRTAYDTAGNPVAVKTGIQLSTASNLDSNAPNDSAFSPAYNAPGPNSTPSAAGETFNVYDQRGRLLETRRTSGSSVLLKESFQYDAVGNRTRVTDAEGNQTAFTYDALGRVLTTTHNAGDPDPANRDTTTNLWNALTLKSVTGPDGKVISYSYDVFHRMAALTAGTTLPEFHYHNALGEKTGVTHNEAGSSWRDTAWSYDTRGRCVSETSLGLTHTYAYDEAGNRISATYAVPSSTAPTAARVLLSSYDRLNRLKDCQEHHSASPTAISVTSYRYDLRGNTVRKTLPNNSFEAKTWDLAGRAATLKTWRSASAPSESSSTAFGYNASGNLVVQDETHPNALGTVDNSARTVTNTYDDAFRLTQEQITGTGGATTVWTYDKAGNRITWSQGGASESYAYNNNDAAEFPAVPSTEAPSYRPNQLRKITRSSGGPVYFRYDKNGNRTRRWEPGASHLTVYAWDQFNRLTDVTTCTSTTGLLTTTGVNRWKYGYDTRSRRIWRLGPTGYGELESFSGGTSVSRWNAGTPDTAPALRTLAMEYIRGSDFGGGVGGVLYSIESTGGTRRFYEYGSRGDVTGHSDTGGIPVFRAAYTAFGSHTDSGAVPASLRQRASTKEEESALGLLNEGFRCRDIRTGAFLSRDPAGFVDGPNLYAYVRQNPWSAFDPEGLFTMDYNPAESLRPRPEIEGGTAAIEIPFDHQPYAPPVNVLGIKPVAGSDIMEARLDLLLNPPAERTISNAEYEAGVAECQARGNRMAFADSMAFTINMVGVFGNYPLSQNMDDVDPGWRVVAEQGTVLATMGLSVLTEFPGKGSFAVKGGDDLITLWKGPGKTVGDIWQGGAIRPRDPLAETIRGFLPEDYPGKGPFFGVGDKGRNGAIGWANYWKNGLQEFPVFKSEYNDLLRRGIIQIDDLEEFPSIRIVPEGLGDFNRMLMNGPANTYYPPGSF